MDTDMDIKIREVSLHGAKNLALEVIVRAIGQYHINIPDVKTTTQGDIPLTLKEKITKCDNLIYVIRKKHKQRSNFIKNSKLIQLVADVIERDTKRFRKDLTNKEKKEYSLATSRLQIKRQSILKQQFLQMLNNNKK